MDTLMWTATTRAQHKRDGLRFASDLTDAEWAVLEPLLPAPSPVGRPPQWPMREIVNAVFYVLRGGVPWRMLADCFPPRQTVYGWFAAWRDAGVWQSVTQHLLMRDRERSTHASMARGQSQRRRDRQPKRQDHRGRRPTRGSLPSGRRSRTRGTRERR